MKRPAAALGNCARGARDTTGPVGHSVADAVADPAADADFAEGGDQRRPSCLLCGAVWGDPHPLFPGEDLKWADYECFVVVDFRRKGKSRDRGDIPKGDACDLCLRALKLLPDSLQRRIPTDQAGAWVAYILRFNLAEKLRAARAEYIKRLRRFHPVAAAAGIGPGDGDASSSLGQRQSMPADVSPARR